ncbi:hypothetical protein FOZ63_024995, partial [Perkinsus olseni]
GVVLHKRSRESGGGTVALLDEASLVEAAASLREGLYGWFLVQWTRGWCSSWQKLCIRSVINVTRLASTMSSSFSALSGVASVITDLMSPSLASSATAPLPTVMYS